jgi:hypothetical protein
MTGSRAAISIAIETPPAHPRRSEHNSDRSSPVATDGVVGASALRTDRRETAASAGQPAEASGATGGVAGRAGTARLPLLGTSRQTGAAMPACRIQRRGHRGRDGCDRAAQEIRLRSRCRAERSPPRVPIAVRQPSSRHRQPEAPADLDAFRPREAGPGLLVRSHPRDRPGPWCSLGEPCSILRV